MTSLLGRIFGSRPRDIEAPAADSGDAYQAAMRESDDLLAKLREAYASNNPVRQVLADVLSQHNNIPYVTSVYETVQEMNSPVKQSANAKLNR